MTDQLESIRKRFDAIIPGPWRWWGNTASDQIYLGTVDRGRLILLDAHTRCEEHVFNYDTGESYTLAEARERVLDWCTVHGDPEFPPSPIDRQIHCKCDEIREFLSGVLGQEEGRRDLHRGVNIWLSRTLYTHAELRFASGREDDADRKQRGGGVLQSYRQIARYEVLGRELRDRFRSYRTIEEFEAETGRDHKEALYREDFCGLDNPEATFIEHAPEDIDYLLTRLTAAERLLEALAEHAAWAMRGQAFQGTADAQQQVAQARLAWEETL